MAFPTGTIKLEAAKAIFTGIEFEVITIGTKTVGYRARYDGKTYENASLTALCKQLWEVSLCRN
jgi:hypothetical protein